MQIRTPRRVGASRVNGDDFHIGFEVEQLPESFGRIQSGYTQTVGGEVSLTDKLSVNVDEKISSERNQGSISPSLGDTRSQGESRLYLKYKNVF